MIVDVTSTMMNPSSSANNKKKVLTTTAVMAAAVMFVGLATIMTTPQPVNAAITEVPIECTNPSGSAPPGQQPECQNESLTQESENQNPAGHAPPGQNP